MIMEQHKILLVDGMALLFRGYYSTAYRGQFMETRNGVPTNGIFQFLRYFSDAVQTFAPTHIICCWDMGSQTFRKDIYEEYKADRSAPPEQLVPQFDLVKEVVAAFNIPNIGLENYEADDCIGTLACQYGVKHEVIVLTGDHDLLQLVTDQTSVALMKKGIGNYDVFTMTNFFEKTSIYPHQWIDLKGLMGDSADNYPGVRGIGEKTAVKLLKEYGTVEQMLTKLDQLPKGIQTKINTHLSMLNVSRQLAAIKCDVPVCCSLEDARWKFDYEQVKRTFLNLEVDHLLTLFM